MATDQQPCANVCIQNSGKNSCGKSGKACKSNNNILNMLYCESSESGWCLLYIQRILKNNSLDSNRDEFSSKMNTFDLCVYTFFTTRQVHRFSWLSLIFCSSLKLISLCNLRLHTTKNFFK